jgi:hypothetical protein
MRIRYWLEQLVRPLIRARARRSGEPNRRAAGHEFLEHLEDRRLLSVFFVSPSGSDANAGTIRSPFQTIQQAADVAGPGDTVIVHAGTYGETVTPVNSGLPAKPITYEPFGDGPVIISGADPVTGWSPEQGDIYEAQVGWDLGPGNNQVFFDGQPLNEARWPATGLDLSHPTFAHAKSATYTIADGSNASSATLFDTALTQPAGFWDGATLHIAPGPGWAIQTGTVTDSAPGQITYSYTSQPTTQAYENPTAGNEYYLTGVPGALDTAGEWFLGNGALSVWAPDGSNPQNDDIEVKHRLHAFDLDGLSDITVRGFSIFAAGITTDANSSNIILSDMNMQYVAQSGIIPDVWTAPEVAGVYLNGSGNVLRDSTIAYSAGDGVCLTGNGDTVQGCVIHDTDYSGANYAAIVIYGADNAAYDNVVYNSGREGIRMNAAASVVNNVVHDVMLQTTDGGGIYTYGTDGTGGEIAYNQVYNVNSAGYGGVGIYLDNNDSNWLVDNNMVWDCTIGIKLNPINTNDQIEDNTVADCTTSVGSSQSAAMPGTVFSNNLFAGPTDIGPGGTEVDDASAGTFQPPADPVVGPALAASHGSLTPPVNNAAVLAADATLVQNAQTQLASDQAAEQQALANDSASMNAAFSAAQSTLQDDIATQPREILAEAALIRREQKAAALAARSRKSPAARKRVLAELTRSIPTIAGYKKALRAGIVADRAAIAAAQVDGQAKTNSDQTQWASVVAADNQALAADNATLQSDAEE